MYMSLKKPKDGRNISIYCNFSDKSIQFTCNMYVYACAYVCVL